MRTAVYSAQTFERPLLDAANAASGKGGAEPHKLIYLDATLNLGTAALARGCAAVSIFVGDDGSTPVLHALHAGGTRLLALRSAGFNHVDVTTAERLGIVVLRVPAYSPHAIAEHTVGLMLVLNRKFHRAFNRVREHNFALDGLMGFDMHGKTVGVIGSGRIGELVCRILTGFGCRVLANDPLENPRCIALGVHYLPLRELLGAADIVTLHCPLTPITRHLIDAAALAAMKPGAMLVNTSRGAVIDTVALIASLKRERLGAVGLDVYEEEGDLFFRDLSERAIQDERFVRLLSFPNVLITAHQGFFTREACTAIAATTIGNLSDFEHGAMKAAHRVDASLLAPTRGAVR